MDCQSHGKTKMMARHGAIHGVCGATPLVLLVLFQSLAPGSAATPPNLTCNATVGLDHPDNDIGPLLHNVTSAEACCAACQALPACVMWVWAPRKDAVTPEPNLCWRKSSFHGSGMPKANRVSMYVPPAPPTPPVTPSKYSVRYRNWTYHRTATGFVVPPSPEGVEGAVLTDCAVVWEAGPGDPLTATAGRFRMFYTYFNNVGYQTALATSPDLLRWNTSAGRIFSYSNTTDAFDYGGVTFGGPLYADEAVSSPRRLKRHVDGRYYVLYGSYPNRNHYESGAGAEGVAWSLDGVTGWTRLSNTTPILSVQGAAAWEQRVIYQPNLVLSNGTMYNFYNALGTNAFGDTGAEQTGLATVGQASFPGVDLANNTSLWVRYPKSPIIANGGPTSYDSSKASDPKVFWDGEQGVWIMFYFGLGGGGGGHADIMFAFSHDLLTWTKDPVPLYKAGGHPQGVDAEHAHKVSLVYDSDGVGYLYYTAVGPRGRGIALLTSRPL